MSHKAKTYASSLRQRNSSFGKFFRRWKLDREIAEYDRRIAEAMQNQKPFAHILNAKNRFIKELG